MSVYEWDPRTSLICDVVICQNASSAATEEVLLQRQLVAGRSYTFQVGGLDGVGGPLDVRFRFFGDRDGDGILDEQPDKCPALAGIPTDAVLLSAPGAERVCAGSTPTRPVKGVVRTLSASGKGTFRAVAGASIGIARNATWITTDRCDGTLTEVGRGRVSVRGRAAGGP